MTRHPSMAAGTAFLALLLAPQSPAQAQHDAHAACAVPPSYVPAALLERPTSIRRGVGNSHERVSTSSAEAQAFYDQGLNITRSTCARSRTS